MAAAITPIHKVKSLGELTNMSRTFIAYHPYHPYDPYLCEKPNQTSLYYSHLTTIWDKSKDGKARKDHVIQTFWYKSESLLAYSLILNKDPDNYQSYTPQHKIGKSLQKEPGSLIRYYKTGKQEDSYKGHSTNYQDLDIDVYKIELWKLIKDVLRLLDCDIQKLEDQVFPTIIEDDDNYNAPTLSDTICTSSTNKKSDINDSCRKAKNNQRNESLDKYRSSPQSALMLSCIW